MILIDVCHSVSSKAPLSLPIPICLLSPAPIPHLHLHFSCPLLISHFLPRLPFLLPLAFSLIFVFALAIRRAGAPAHKSKPKTNVGLSTRFIGISGNLLHTICSVPSLQQVINLNLPLLCSLASISARGPNRFVVLGLLPSDVQHHIQKSVWKNNLICNEAVFDYVQFVFWIFFS